jgi:hypothetical protein
MTGMKRVVLSFLLIAGVGGCSSSSTEHAGQTCQAETDCYKGLSTAPKGAVSCLTKVSGGYCTHLCQTDADCCAVAGECKTGLPQVCGPFESTGMKMCFLTCEASAVAGKDPNTFCQENAHSSFSCRSTGGGAENRKVCVPAG